MNVVRDSEDELVILSPARGARLAGAFFLGFGIFIAFLVGLPLIRGGILSLSRSPQEKIWGVPAAAVMIPAGAMLCLIPISGLGLLIKSRDREFQFRRRTRQLVITADGRVERVIPFSDILKVEMYEASGNDEATSYGLRLKLSGFGQVAQISQIDRSGERWRNLVADLAKRIGQTIAVDGESGA